MSTPVDRLVSRAARVAAFTLIELLVVIAIIGILASMLLPVLGKAKDKAKAAHCLNAVKQWGLAQMLYVGDNNENLPRDGMNAAGTYGNATGHPNDPAGWFNLLPQYMADKPLSNYWANANSPTYSVNVANMPYPGGTLGKFWHCAAAKQGTPPSLNGQYGFFSFAMSIDLKKADNSGVGGPSLAYPAMPVLAQFSQPTRTVLMFDTVYDPVGEVVNASPQFNSVNPANRWRSFAVRHSGNAGNIVFMDGHASQVNTNTVLPQQANGNEKIGVDLIWNSLYREANP